MNDFDGLAFYDIVAIFANSRVDDVPVLKIDVNIVIIDGLSGSIIVFGIDEWFCLFPYR